MFPELFSRIPYHRLLRSNFARILGTLLGFALGFSTQADVGKLPNTVLHQDRRCAPFGDFPWLFDARFSATGVLDGKVRSYPLLCLDDNFIRVSRNNQAGGASV
jgi:hypothetical protein